MLKKDTFHRILIGIACLIVLIAGCGPAPKPEKSLTLDEASKDFVVKFRENFEQYATDIWQNSFLSWGDILDMPALLLRLKENPNHPVYKNLSEQNKTFITEFTKNPQLREYDQKAWVDDLNKILVNYDLYQQLRQYYGNPETLDSHLSEKTKTFRNQLTFFGKETASLGDEEKLSVKWLNHYILQDLYPYALQKRFAYHLFVKPLKKTLWIYLALEHPVFDFEAKATNPLGFGRMGMMRALQKLKPKPSIMYLEGDFKDKTFSFEYDIVKTLRSEKDPGIGNNYTPEYIQAQNGIFTAISRTFFEVERTPDFPDFFVIVITDIAKGIETQATFYFEDFKRYMSQAIPYDEFIKRYTSESRGDKFFIGDMQGHHLDYKEIQMPEFLTQQIMTRIRFKYRQSDFPPGEDDEDEILKAVGEVTSGYHFEDFTTIKLHNLRQDKEYLFNKSQLKTFSE